MPALEKYLESKTCKELRAFAKDHGVCLGYDAKNKTSMISAIATHIYQSHTSRTNEKHEVTASEATCPWCGYVLTDSWELSDEEESIECPNCYLSFSCTRNIDIDYTTRQLEEK